MKRRYPYMRKKRPLQPLTRQTAPTFVIAEYERLCRENHELRGKMADVRRLVVDMNMRKTTLGGYMLAVIAIRRVVCE